MAKPEPFSKKASPKTLGWQVHTYGLFKEILSDPQNRMLTTPLNILLDLLRKVAIRASELNDKKMNELMIRLCLYSIANPEDPEYNPKLVSKILREVGERKC
jgi:hypothetical protein